MPAAGQGNDTGSREHIVFDIPAQPLAAALNAYGAATHIPIFVDTELTAGHRSAALKGVFAPEAGLQSLLAGTGLTARPIEDEGFTLVRLHSAGMASGRVSGVNGPIPQRVLQFGGYSAAVQDALRAAVCQLAETRPGSYRSLVRLWIGASGSVVRAALLTSTGDASRDALLSGALQKLAIGVPPPSDLPQPVTLLLAPSAELAESYCPASDTAPDRADTDGADAR
jgi:hypothetical protein